MTPRGVFAAIRRPSVKCEAGRARGGSWRGGGRALGHSGLNHYILVERRAGHGGRALSGSERGEPKRASERQSDARSAERGAVA